MKNAEELVSSTVKNFILPEVTIRLQEETSSLSEMLRSLENI
jgi:hypothetical protein